MSSESPSAAQPRSAPRPSVRLAHVCSSDLGIPPLMPFCRPLLERGWEITMITPDGPHVELATRAGMKWLPLALQRRLHAPSDVVGTLQLARYFVRERYDIVHTHNIKAGHIARVVGAAMRVPLVVHTIHGMAYSLETPPLRRYGHALLERIASLGCDMVFSQSREDADTYLATHVIDPERLLVIGNGIDLTRFDPVRAGAARSATRKALGIEPDDIVFFSAGRLIVEKGFLELFDALRIARAKNPRVRLAIAGDGEDAPRVVGDHEEIGACVLDEPPRVPVDLARVLGRRNRAPIRLGLELLERILKTRRL